jgi:hypothetical protein
MPAVGHCHREMPKRQYYIMISFQLIDVPVGETGSLESSQISSDTPIWVKNSLERIRVKSTHPKLT